MAPVIRKPVILIRLSTERPEAVETGFAQVVGTDKRQILNAIEEEVLNPRKLPLGSPFGKGKGRAFGSAGAILKGSRFVWLNARLLYNQSQWLHARSAGVLCW